MDLIAITWIIWPILGLLVGMRKREPVAGFFLPFFCGPLGLLFVLLSSGRGKKCPHCMSVVPKAATRCAHCGGEL